MNILADTQIVVWSLDISSPLSKRHRELLEDTRNRIVTSYISLMELVIKKSIGKLPEFVPDITEVAAQWVTNGFEILPLSEKQIYAYQTLPLFQEHRDPFDRFIISVALEEGFKVLTEDKKFGLYSSLIEIILKGSL